MPIILTWLGQALTWLSGSFVGKWIASKVLIISILTVVLPWVLKDALQWFWKVGEEYRYQIAQYFSDQLSTLLGSSNLDLSLNITGVAGYIANEIGLINYFSIIITGLTICCSIRLIGKFL